MPDITVRQPQQQITVERGKDMFPDDAELSKMWDMARAFSTTNLVRRHLQNNAPAIFYSLNIGKELGIHWSHSLRSLYITDKGEVGVEGNIIGSLLWSKGFKITINESTDKRAEVTITRPNDGGSHTDSFTIEEAAKAGLTRRWNRDKQEYVDDFSWKAYPKDKLYWRALMRTARRVAVDVMYGLYLDDELRESERAERDAALASGNGMPSDSQSEQLEAANQYYVGKKQPSVEAEAEAHIVSAEPAPPAGSNAEFSQAAKERAAANKKPEAPATTASSPDSGSQAAPVDPGKGPGGLTGTQSPSPESEPSKPAADQGMAAAVKAKILELTDKWPTLSPEVAKQKLQQAVKGWHGVNRLPTDPKAYLSPLAAIECAMKFEGGVIDQLLKREPAQFGKAAKTAFDQVNAKMADWKWPGPVRALALEVWYLRMSPLESDEFIDWIQNTLEISGLPEKDLAPFFECALISRQCFRLVLLSRKLNLPVSELAGSFLRDQPHEERALTNWLDGLEKQDTIKTEDDAPTDSPQEALPWE